MTKRLLFVEQSATMRQVMAKHAESLGFAVDACDSYEQAVTLLSEQFQQYGSDYTAIVFGWPTIDQDDAQVFAQRLEADQHKGLPVVVMSTDMRAPTRAWAAARDASAILSWKNYHEIDGVLKKLIDVAPAQSGNRVPAIKNNGVNILIVDDSATIRLTLKDLFESSGYRVTLAASHGEAMAAAEQNQFEIAVVDFYLSNSTGDVLCRELIASEHTGDIVCTVLTGTYSDHIIKQSLSAGAVECMFKNESSGLLLARIDAISRLTRSNKRLRSERSLLESVIQHMAGAVLLVGFDQKIIYTNPLAQQHLLLASGQSLIGYPLEQLVGSTTDIKESAGLREATWHLPGGKQVEVDYTHANTDSKNVTMLRFSPRVVPIDVDNVAVLQQDHGPENTISQIVKQHGFQEESKHLLLLASNCIEASVANQTQQNEDTAALTSLLLIDVFVRDDKNDLVPLVDNHPVAKQLVETLGHTVKQANQVSLLRDNRFALLIEHKDRSEAYVATRLIMQQCIELSDQEKTPPLNVACTGSLLSLTQNSSQALGVLVQHAITGLDLVNDREPNQAILLDVRRLLSAYPAK